MITSRCFAGGIPNVVLFNTYSGILAAVRKSTPQPNPFVYGRVLGIADAACPRPRFEASILQAVRDKGRLALAGDRRLGKSTLVERTLAAEKHPLLRWDFHRVYSVEDLVHRAAEQLDAFVRGSSPIARKLTPWLREIGVGIDSIRLSYQGTEAALRVRTPTDHLARLLGYIGEIAKRRDFALFIDELQDVRDGLPEREGDAVLGLLRSELQRLRTPCFFAGSSRESFRALFMGEASPFYESARLLEVTSIPVPELRAFLVKQFARGHYELPPEAANVLLAIGGESPNDVQHLAHETWNAAVGPRIGGGELGRALSKILSDLTPMADTWLGQLTRRQQRVLMATALYEHVGSGTEMFLRAAGVHNNGAITSALRPCIHTRDPIVEKVGSRYRIRSRYLRLWLATRQQLAPELIPLLRPEGVYSAALRTVCPQLPEDLES
jgi:hypothetical protein